MKKYLPALLLLIAAPAFAHTGYGLLTFNDGLLHPLTGLDHLLMLSAVGILSANRDQPFRFTGLAMIAMFVGALIGHQYGDFTGMEPLINFSVFAASGVILCAAQGRTVWLVPVLLSVHGWAHGVEGSTGDAFYTFTIGFLISSAAVLLAGHFLGKLVFRNNTLRKIVGAGWIAAMTLNLLSA